MRRVVRSTLAALVALGAVALVSQTALACPMCSQSIAEEAHLPRAYMYSILFMLAMPAMVFTGLSLCIYRQFRRHAAAHVGLDAAQAALDQPGERAV